LEHDLTRDDALTADAVFTSSTLRDVALVTHVDGIAMPAGEAAKRVLAIGAEFTIACDRRASDIDMPAAIELAQRAK
jgi:hypothetical protein